MVERRCCHAMAAQWEPSWPLLASTGMLLSISALESPLLSPPLHTSKCTNNRMPSAHEEEAQTLRRRINDRRAKTSFLFVPMGPRKITHDPLKFMSITPRCHECRCQRGPAPTA